MINIHVWLNFNLERPTIFFDSHDVSKPDSVSLLSILDDCEKSDVRPTISGELLDRVISMLRVALEMNLFGVDIVVEKGTGHYAIIDINAFPGRIKIKNEINRFVSLFLICWLKLPA